VRYTQSNMGGYTVSATGAVTAPLTYSALNTNPTTALAGVGGYDVEKNQRLDIAGIYRQELYQAVQTASVIATYTVSL
jgi:hypothetical protein